MKKCKKCGEEKPLDAFYFDRGKPQARCKECRKKAQSAYHAGKRDEINASRRQQRKQDPETHRSKRREYWAKRKDEINAQRRERRAEPDGARIREMERQWFLANRQKVNDQQRARWITAGEEIKARRRADRLANPEKHRAWAKTSRERNAEKVRDRQRAYYLANPDVFDKHRRLRRARKAGVESAPYTRREIWERDGARCCLCDAELPFAPHAFHIDHIVPIVLGGPDTPANVQLACPACNLRKSSALEGQIYFAC